MSVEISLHDADRTNRTSLVQQLWRAQESRLLIAILIGSALLASQSDAFLTLRNLRSALMGFSFLARARLGDLAVSLTGRSDVSVGAVMRRAGMISSLALANGMSPELAVCVGIGIGGLAGLINGIFAVSLGINAF